MTIGRFTDPISDRRINAKICELTLERNKLKSELNRIREKESQMTTLDSKIKLPETQEEIVETLKEINSSLRELEEKKISLLRKKRIVQSICKHSFTTGYACGRPYSSCDICGMEN